MQRFISFFFLIAVLRENFRKIFLSVTAVRAEWIILYLRSI